MIWWFITFPLFIFRLQIYGNHLILVDILSHDHPSIDAAMNGDDRFSQFTPGLKIGINYPMPLVKVFGSVSNYELTSFNKHELIQKKKILGKTKSSHVKYQQ